MADRTGDLDRILGECTGETAALTPRKGLDVRARADLSPVVSQLSRRGQTPTGAWAWLPSPSTWVKPGAITSMPSNKSSSMSHGDINFCCAARRAGAHIAL